MRQPYVVFIAASNIAFWPTFDYEANILPYIEVLKVTSTLKFQ